jgi:HlyD family secretion protein
MNTDVVIQIMNKDVSLSAPSMSLRTRKDIYSAAALLDMNKEDIDTFLVNKVKGENFNKFIVIKESKKGPILAWVQIGLSDLANVEIIDGLSSGYVLYILPSMSLVNYQKRFKERVNASFSFGA